jgi:hypothetical protein
MTARGPLVVALVLDVLGGFFAIVAGPGSLVSVAGALLAVLSAGGATGLVLTDRLSRPPSALPADRADPVGRLRGALRPRSLGRERAIFALQELEFASGARHGASWSPDELRGMFAWSPEQFATWLQGRLDQLERET